MRYAHMYYYYYYCYAYITILYQPIIQKKVVQGYRKKNRGLTLKYLMVIPIFQGKIFGLYKYTYNPDTYQVSRM